MQYTVAHDFPYIENCGAYLFSAVTAVAMRRYRKSLLEAAATGYAERESDDRTKFERALADAPNDEFFIAALFYLYRCNVKEISLAVGMNKRDVKRNFRKLVCV